jgi:RNase H-fold protein (predicted Holliday junction resolvase)
LPVYLQDERLTSVEASQKLREAGYSNVEIRELVDGEAAALILGDFLQLTAEEQETRLLDPNKVDPKET